VKDASREINGYLNHYIQLLDMKATAIAAAALIALSLGLSSQAADAQPVLKFIGLVSAGVAVVFAGVVVFPRTPRPGSGHVFWGDIRHFDCADTYWQSLRTLDDEALGREYAYLNYFVSGALLKKGAMVRAAIVCFAVSCMALAAAVAFGNG
jgi:hypothetical protein